ncbi:LOW QUALITY PROTEIN: serine protease 55 [Cuculus canorus]|uniref:LOW QUALITY PROTEIN: serine protease 55 n=1 Tax=Cuculus canorus TaxID=55661 RepID=UPI0023AAF714|nr:LOW QUALITY PROTEIN: serine protease 55 [Cuculus canorus]
MLVEDLENKLFRITAGRYAKTGEFPWHVSIQSNGNHICGGTIISALWILTAAHCFEEAPPDLTVVVGGTDLSLPMEEYKLDSLILHKNFDRMSIQNDITLVLLSSPIKFSNEKIPICLPFIYDIDTWQNCWVAGWGTTLAVPASHVLQKAQMKLISRQQCLVQMPQLDKDENVLCAELERGQKGPCQGTKADPACTVLTKSASQGTRSKRRVLAKDF